MTSLSQIKLDPELYDGNIEYKLKLTNLDDEKLEKRATQMKYRIHEGSGEAIYMIGVLDNGLVQGIEEKEYLETIDNLKKIALKIDCIITKISENISNNLYSSEYLIRENDTNTYIDLKIGVAGNVDAGKSTTIGTLTKGILDDGRGKARVHVFNYKHEVETGRTSSIGHQIMGYDKDGTIINSKYDRTPTWQEIVQQSSKIVSFYDFAGHEKYLRTTIYGLTSMFPDYCLIMVGANMGINHMTKEHISLCLTLKIPFIIIISKIDIVPDNILEDTLTKIKQLCKNGIRKVPFLVKNISDVINVAKNIKSDSIVPIIQISNVTNHNLDLLKTLFNILPIRNDFSQAINLPVEFLIDNTYSVTGHPVIVSGILKSGTIKINDLLSIGPYYDGSYKQVKVRSIHCKYKEVKEAKAGLYICVSIKNISRGEIKKGMVLVPDNNISSKLAVREFKALVHILHSPTTIRIGYRPFIHVDQIRQSVEIIEIIKINDDDNLLLRTGDKAYVKLRFISKPEHIKPDMRLIFREGKVRAVGKVVADDLII
jgi:GTPase